MVLKGVGAVGHGNLFLDAAFANERPLYTELKTKIIAFMQKQASGFVVEAVKMFPAVRVRTDVSENAKPGAYFRDMVFYNTQTGETTCIPVFREIIDMAKSTNNHDSTATIEENTYLLESTPFKLQKLTDITASVYPEYHRAKQNNFGAIGKSLFERMYRTPTKDLACAHKTLARKMDFAQKFHRNKQDYLDFFDDLGNGLCQRQRNISSFPVHFLIRLTLNAMVQNDSRMTGFFAHHCSALFQKMQAKQKIKWVEQIQRMSKKLNISTAEFFGPTKTPGVKNATAAIAPVQAVR
jgi:hypothetical protein